jgi:hypothetical protein
MVKSRSQKPEEKKSVNAVLSPFILDSVLWLLNSASETFRVSKA